MNEGILTGWRIILIVWTLAVLVVIVPQNRGVLAPLFIWFVGLLVIGGVRAALGSALRR